MPKSLKQISDERKKIIQMLRNDVYIKIQLLREKDSQKQFESILKKQRFRIIKSLNRLINDIHNSKPDDPEIKQRLENEAEVISKLYNVLQSQTETYSADIWTNPKSMQKFKILLNDEAQALNWEESEMKKRATDQNLQMLKNQFEGITVTQISIKKVPAIIVKPKNKPNFGIVIAHGFMGHKRAFEYLGKRFAKNE